MAILRWVPELDTGIDEIDVQHRRIVDYINRLYALRDSPDRDGLGEVIAEMVDYTISHFAFEEGVMENAGYMFAGPHKRVHELFTRKVAEMQSRFDAGENVTQELHGMLSRWLFNHIRNEDHGYVDSVHAYQRMLVNQRNADMAHMKEEVLRELKAERSKRSWWARLFGG
jgi:hemerythrin